MVDQMTNVEQLNRLNGSENQKRFDPGAVASKHLAACLFYN